MHNIQRPLAEMKHTLSGYRIGSPRTREGYVVVMKIIIKDFYHLKRFFDSFQEIGLDDVMLLIQHWRKKSLSVATISSRISILRKYLGLIRHSMLLPSNVALGLSRNREKAREKLSVDIRDVIQRIYNPINRLLVELQWYFGLTKEEAVRFRLQRYAGDEAKLYLSKPVSYNNQDRLIPLYHPEQEEVLARLTQAVGGSLSLAEKHSATDVIRLYCAELHLYGLSSKIPFRYGYAKHTLPYLLDQGLPKKSALASIAEAMGITRIQTIEEWVHE